MQTVPAPGSTFLQLEGNGSAFGFAGSSLFLLGTKLSLLRGGLTSLGWSGMRVRTVGLWSMNDLIKGSVHTTDYALL